MNGIVVGWEIIDHVQAAHNQRVTAAIATRIAEEDNVVQLIAELLVFGGP